MAYEYIFVKDVGLCSLAIRYTFLFFSLGKTCYKHKLDMITYALKLELKF